MVSRNIPESLLTVEYIDGYLNQVAGVDHGLDYGYDKNHLPETTGKSRKTVSSLDLITE